MVASPRQQLSLDGAWQFRLDPAADLTIDAPGPWRTIAVPAPWQSQADDLRFATGTAWYRRAVEVPAEWQGGALFLTFGAVDYHADVFVNGERAGEHTGGYLPFELDVTGLLNVGATNQVAIRVTDPDDDRERYPVPFTELPHGKQNWYGPLSGIWQSVTLERRPTGFIASLRLTPDAATGRLDVIARLAGVPPHPTPLVLTVLAPDGALLLSASADAHGAEVMHSFSIESARRWELDDPALYTVRATLGDDTLTARCGFRSFAARDGALYLNDRPLMLRGALDQDYYPELIATPPSYEYLLEQARLAKRMGLNCLRCHIKVPDPRYLDAADEVGLLVWSELPNWTRWTPDGGERGVQQLLGQIERDWNHPSLVIWTIINESWGLDQQQPEQRAWLVDAFARIKAADPQRLVVDNSACIPNYHLISDIDDYHYYAAMPDERGKWDEWVRQFADRADWSYGRDAAGAALPEVTRTKQEPLIVSEFGNWGLPSLASLRGASGRDPWWFETGDDWGSGEVYPHGVEERFRRLGLARVFGDYETFAAATRRSELDALRYEIESMRRHASIGGYVITEFTDVHWECNGLLDMQRAPKIDLSALAELNADTILLPDRGGRAWRAGETRDVAVAVSHWGAAPLETAELRWRFGDDSGAHAARRSIAPRSTVPLGAVAVAAPQVNAPQLHTLRLELWEGGRRVAATELRVPVYPQDAPPRRSVIVHGSDALRARLAAAGTAIAENSDAGALIVADVWDAALEARVRGGASALLIAETAEAAGSIGRMQVRAREGSPWQGSWASSFCWLGGAWAGDGVLDESFVGCMPDHVLAGLSSAAFERDVLAGLVVGWIHRPAALAAIARIGQGQVLATTFKLVSAGADDPAASALLARLMDAA